MPRLVVGIAAGLAAALLALIQRQALAAIVLPHAVQCDEVIGAATSPGPNERVVLDRVSLPPERFPYPPEPQAQGRLPYFAKYGLTVRAGSQPVEVVVPSIWRARFAIGWGNHGSYEAAVVRISGCPPSAAGDWLTYPGGYYLRRPAWVPLTERLQAEAGGRTASPVGWP